MALAKTKKNATGFEVQEMKIAIYRALLSCPTLTVICGRMPFALYSDDVQKTNLVQNWQLWRKPSQPSCNRIPQRNYRKGPQGTREGGSGVHCTIIDVLGTK